jgi:hypothetical protein
MSSLVPPSISPSDLTLSFDFPPRITVSSDSLEFFHSLNSTERSALLEFLNVLNNELAVSESNPQPIDPPYTPKHSPPSLVPPPPASFCSLYSTCESHTKDFHQLIRFLRARNFDLQATLELFKRFLAWRHAFHLSNLSLLRPHIERELSSGKAYWCGFDSEGRPALIVRPVKHLPKQIENIEETIRFAVYLMEEGTEILRNSSFDSQLVLIYDRHAMTRANFDSRLIQLARELTAITQDFYAERLYRSYIFPVNWFYWLVYKMISPFIAQKTKEKLVILSDYRELNKHFNPEGLSERYGGKVVDKVFRQENGEQMPDESPSAEQHEKEAE